MRECGYLSCQLKNLEIWLSSIMNISNLMSHMEYEIYTMWKGGLAYEKRKCKWEYFKYSKFPIITRSPQAKTNNI